MTTTMKPASESTTNPGGAALHPPATDPARDTLRGGHRAQRLFTIECKRAIVAEYDAAFASATTSGTLCQTAGIESQRDKRSTDLGIASTITTALILSAVGIGLSPASVASASPALDSSTASGVVSPATVGTEVLGTTVTTVQPDLDPIGVAECNLGISITAVTNYLTSKFSLVTMYCGTDTSSGYNHIRFKHQKDWQNKLNSTGGSGNWDDFMDYATRQALTKPEGGYPKYEGDNKWCYTAPIDIFQGKKLVNVFRPTVLISSNNLLVITSFPSTTPNCKGN